MSLRARIALPAISLALLLSLRSRAACAQSAHIEAEIRAQQAREATRRNEVAEAVRLYRLSLAINATPRTWHELALVYETSGDVRRAADAWTHYATSAVAQGDRDAALVHREQLRRTPSRLRVRVEPLLAARDAHVWFDRDRPRPVPAGGAESVVEGGPHRVRVEAAGYAVFETMVTTAYGEPAEVLVRLQPVNPGGDAPGARGADAGARY